MDTPTWLAKTPFRRHGDYYLTSYKNESKNEWSITAQKANGATVGEAQFVSVRDYNEENPYGVTVGLKGWDVKVDAAHQRKGIATAMYRYAGDVFRLPIQAGSFQTPDGEAFWKSKLLGGLGVAGQWMRVPGRR